VHLILQSTQLSALDEDGLLLLLLLLLLSLLFLLLLSISISRLMQTDWTIL